MEETTNETQALFLFPENKIRSVQSNLQTHLENFESEFPETTFVEPSFVCDIVRAHILEYEDEPHLSKTQNNCRRISIASELFVSICSAYALTIDYEHGKIISHMLQWEKYKKLFYKITSLMKQQSRTEKYFATEAQGKLFKNIEETQRTNLEDEKIKQLSKVSQLQKEGAKGSINERGFEDKIAVRYERTSPLRKKLLKTTEEETQGYEINETLALPLETSMKTNVSSSFLGNMTDIRGEPTTESFFMEQDHHSNVSIHEMLLPSMDLEVSIGEPSILQKKVDDINQVLQILEDEISPKKVVEIEQDNISKTRDIGAETSPKELLTENQPYEYHAVDSESTEWSLPSLENTEETNKQHQHLIIDKETTIRDYAAKALRLNRNINIQRVQVFEGPPKILQAISSIHLMTAPSYKSSVFHDVRNSKLNKLYNRHLKVEKKPAETFMQGRTVEEPRKFDVTKAGTYGGVRVRAGMHSAAEENILAEILEKRLEDLEFTGGALSKESLIGMPMSRIITSTVKSPEKPEMERINKAPILPFTRAQQFQGVDLEQKASPPGFLFTKESPPSDKYRNFIYIYKKLQKYWSMFDSQGMEKCITMREFFSFEEETSIANFLTMLRVVDKMSIQRKLLVEHKSGDVFIRPFECPYISEGQLLLKEKELIL